MREAAKRGGWGAKRVCVVGSHGEEVCLEPSGSRHDGDLSCFPFFFSFKLTGLREETAEIIIKGHIPIHHLNSFRIRPYVMSCT